MAIRDLITKWWKEMTAPCDDDHTVFIKYKPWKYWAVVAFIVILSGTSLASALFFHHLFGGIQAWDLYFPFSWPLSVLLAGYIYDAWYSVHAQEYGGIFVIHQTAIPVGPGLIFAPRWITRLHKAPRDAFTLAFPAEPDKITHVHDNEDLPEGMVRPLRVLTGSPDPDHDPNDPLNSQRQLEIQWYMRAGVEQRHFFDFWSRLPGGTWDEKMASLRKQAFTIGTESLASDLNELHPCMITSKLGEINAKLRERLQTRFDGTGIVIYDAGMQSPDLGQTVSEALANLAASKANAKKREIEGGGERTYLAQVGLGNAAADEAMIVAEGVGIKKAAKAVGVSGREYLAARVAETTLGKGTIVIGTDGVKEAIGIGKAVLGTAVPPAASQPST